MLQQVVSLVLYARFKLTWTGGTCWMTTSVLHLTFNVLFKWCFHPFLIRPLHRKADWLFLCGSSMGLLQSPTNLMVSPIYLQQSIPDSSFVRTASTIGIPQKSDIYPNCSSLMCPAKQKGNQVNIWLSGIYISFMLGFIWHVRHA